MQITLNQRVDDGERVWYAGSVVEISKYPRLEARLRELGLLGKATRAPADKMVRSTEPGDGSGRTGYMVK